MAGRISGRWGLRHSSGDDWRLDSRGFPQIALSVRRLGCQRHRRSKPCTIPMMAAASTFDSPFSRSDARAAGIPLVRLLGSEFHKVGYDQYVAASVPVTTLVRARSALGLSPPGAHISHYTGGGAMGRSRATSGDVGHPHQPAEREQGGPCDEESRRTFRRDRRELRFSRVCACRRRSRRFSTWRQSLDLVELVVIGDKLVKAAANDPDEAVRRSREMGRHRVQIGAPGRCLGAGGGRLTDGVSTADAAGAGRASGA